jgi:trigger factor
VNIRLEKLNDLEASVLIEMSKADYQEKVDAQIKKIQKTAAIRGFRSGKAPMGMIQKMYGKTVLADEIQQIASQKLNEFIEEQKLETLGYPLGSTRFDSKLDIENSEDFVFAFDLGIAPKFELDLTTKDKLDLFQIEVTNKEIDEDIEYARKRHAKLDDATKSDAESIVYAEVNELGEDGQPLEGGVSAKSVSFVPSMIENKKLQKQFVGIEKGFSTTCDVRELFNNNESVLTSALAVTKEAISDLSASFSVNVTEIKSRTLPELNEDYFREVFPTETPSSEAEYRERVKANLEHYYKNEASLWLDHEIGHLIMTKHDIQLPDDFLKRWLMETKTEDYNAENIDEKYAQEKDALKRRLIIDKLAEQHDLKAEQAEVIEEARLYYVGMYKQYGLDVSMIGQDFLNETIAKRLQEREFVGQMSDRVIYRKSYDKVREMISINDKKTSVEDYFNHVNKHKDTHGE